MIEEISIRSLGVIGEATLPLGPGFTAITGETGAGKTMVVSALGLLLGERGDAAAIRSGATQAVVEGRWLIDPESSVAERVRDAGGDLDDEGSAAGLLLTRAVTQEGRSRATVGGRSAPVKVLSEIGESLVVVHGQSDQVRLRSASAQREALDRFAGEPVAAVLGDYQTVYRRWQAAQAELDLLTEERDRRGREADDLRSALAEIEAIAPQRGEDVQLAETIDRLSNLEELRLAAAQAQELVSSQSGEDVGDALGFLDQARRLLDRASEHDASLVPVVGTLAEATALAAEVSAQLAHYLGGLDADGAAELATLQERRAELGALVRKHGTSLDDVLDRFESGGERLIELDGDTDRIEALGAEVGELRERIILLGDRLTELRSAAATQLGERVTEELAALAMATARVTVQLSDRPEYATTGKDQVEFLLQPHPGSEPRALARGASGGELSRVMLAIEVVIAATDPIPTFIFDEVDAGVGGASAIEIGRRLARLATTAQVIAVTHLAQVAAFATNHLTVVKDVDGAVTASSVRQLSGEDRVAEMARLLSGLPDSESGLTHARELLDLAADDRATV
ncbi:DNA repair protein RecN [Galbitalea soli]|uniref:DNA repair protein RecN n=1 Tax=Galbitalea soli TaxID=1268042 RepID=A0A7C9TN37_9MICO|nr:DNA repair protein RecN [Galbitalea soli]NYJ30621.1 DNA repair protein RecN (Recombination protein N) [Galbitalea soli]